MATSGPGTCDKKRQGSKPCLPYRGKRGYLDFASAFIGVAAPAAAASDFVAEAASDFVAETASGFVALAAAFVSDRIEWVTGVADVASLCLFLLA